MKILNRLGTVTAKDENYVRVCYLFNPYEEIYNKKGSGGFTATKALEDHHFSHRIYFQKEEGLGCCSYNPLWSRGEDENIDDMISSSLWKKGYIKLPFMRPNSSGGQVCPGNVNYPENMYVGMAILKLGKKSDYDRDIIESLEKKDSIKNLYSPHSNKLLKVVEDYILKGKKPKFDETDLNKVIKDWGDNYSYVPCKGWGDIIGLV